MQELIDGLEKNFPDLQYNEECYDLIEQINNGNNLKLFKKFLICLYGCANHEQKKYILEWRFGPIRKNYSPFVSLNNRNTFDEFEKMLYINSNPVASVECE